MTEFNMTDQEQMAMIKKWWDDYGKIIVTAVAIGLVIAFGWRYWRQHQVKQSQHASLLYSKLGIADSQKKPKVAEKIAATLMQEYRSTPYAAMAALWWARELVHEKNYPAALQKSDWVVKHSRINPFKQVARIRSARILLAQKNNQAALKRLQTVDDKTYQPLIDAVKGDIYTAMKKPEATAKAYHAAKAGMSAIGFNNPILDMKLAQP